jgi:hypothetical protein
MAYSRSRKRDSTVKIVEGLSAIGIAAEHQNNAAKVARKFGKEVSAAARKQESIENNNKQIYQAEVVRIGFSPFADFAANYFVLKKHVKLAANKQIPKEELQAVTKNKLKELFLKFHGIPTKGVVQLSSADSAKTCKKILAKL